jgi:tRNA-splicing ligase RtcB (3'-phosphate/5'-hydroxy nucleic acid ligase)
VIWAKRTQSGGSALKNGVSMQVLSEDRHPIKMWTEGVPVEDSALIQLHNVAGMPFIHRHVAVMPDVHWGMGATVGSVIATKGAIIPAAVGVDIGCGMIAERLNIKAADLPEGSLPKIRAAIEEAVPHGRTNNGRDGDKGAWGWDSPREVGTVWATLESRLEAIFAKHPKLRTSNSRRHLGTLGTGNHFIEVCHDEAGDLWVMLHSGSRGVGNAIGSYFIERAKRLMEQWFVQLPDKDLAYLPDGTPEFADYSEAVAWAQDFAFANRGLMMDFTIKAIQSVIPQPIESTAEVVNCHHNYVARENHFGQNVWVTRKGAVRARLGDLGIIPGSMGAKSFIVRGKGNKDSFESCSHGAGRKMSRGEARRTFTLADHEAATLGIECRKDVEVIDETPAAYKSIDAVMAAQSALVEIVHTLKQEICVKG